MAVRYVTGVLGHGKSLYGARAIARALNTGRVVCSNMRLLDGWQEKVLRHNPYYVMSGRRSKREYEREISTRYYFEQDFVKLLGARIRGYGESRGVRVFDESHNALNNRDWEKKDQKLMLRRLSLSRKRGWDDYIISQHAKNTDVSIRRIAHSEIRVIDWQKILLVPVFHTKLLPFHWFLAQEFPIEESAVPGVQKLGKRIGMEMYHLGWWCKIYDTFEDYEFDDDLLDQGVVLPLPMPPLLAATPGGPTPALATESAAGAAGAPLSLDAARKALMAGGPVSEPDPPDATAS